MLAALTWDALLVADGVVRVVLVGAALLAAANAAVGVLADQAVLSAYRWLRRRPLRRAPAGAGA